MAQNIWNANLYNSKHGFVTNYGNDVIELLNPQINETILDVGCGSGDLTAKIAQLTNKAIGIDSSEEMIAKAIQSHPEVEFFVQNAEKPFNFDFKFDAVFSNAALHWMLDTNALIQNIANTLKPNGRFVFEMGGKGNINTIIKSIEYSAGKFNLTDLPIYNFFPSIFEYATILEQHGLEVKYAVLFDRPTKLDGEAGLRNWITMFRNGVLNKLPQENHEDFFQIAEQYAKEKLYKDGQWIADYVRLRMVAIKK